MTEPGPTYVGVESMTKQIVLENGMMTSEKRAFEV